MSTAHRPNFDAAKGRESKAHLSQQTSKFDLASHTKLKFRQTPPTVQGGVRRDLKRELEEAEWEAKNKRRIAAGLEPLAPPHHLRVQTQDQQEEDEETKRRKQAIAQAIELDRISDSDSSSSDNDDPSQAESGSGSGSESESEAKPHNSSLPPAKTSSHSPAPSHSNSESDSDSDSDSEDSEEEQEQEQEQEEKMLERELEKIRAERRAEKARQASLESHTSHLTHQHEIATGNPLLNLETVLSPSNSTTNTDPVSTQLDFAVTKRWDHDIIFKNQAAQSINSNHSTGFVNHLTRSEFHKKFMNRYIK